MKVLLPPLQLAACLVLGLSIAGCEVAPGEQSVPNNLEIAHAVQTGAAVQHVYGTPEGEPVLFPPGGYYTAAQAGDPAFGQAQAAVAVAGLELATLAAEAPTWSEAHQQVQAFLAAPPKEAEVLPAYVLEQAAAQAMYYYRPDLLSEDAAAPGRIEAVEVYLDLLLRNRHPNPEPVAALLEALAGTWEAGRVARAAEQAQKAEQAYAAALRQAVADAPCPECVERQINAMTNAAKQQQAAARLAALAASAR